MYQCMQEGDSEVTIPKTLYDMIEHLLDNFTKFPFLIVGNFDVHNFQAFLGQ